MLPFDVPFYCLLEFIFPSKTHDFVEKKQLKEYNSKVMLHFDEKVDNGFIMSSFITSDILQL